MSPKYVKSTFDGSDVNLPSNTEWKDADFHYNVLTD